MSVEKSAPHFGKWNQMDFGMYAVDYSTYKCSYFDKKIK